MTLLLGVCQSHSKEGKIQELLHHTLEEILRRNQCLEYPVIAFLSAYSSYHLCRILTDYQAAVVLLAELGALVPSEIFPTEKK